MASDISANSNLGRYDQFAAIENFGEVDIWVTYFKLEKAGMDVVLQWCMYHGLIAKGYSCPVCKKPMKLAPCSNIKDKFNWLCQVNGEDMPHSKTCSIRCGSWFDGSSLSLTKILLLTSMWNSDLPPKFLARQMGVSLSTVTNWCYLCREVVFKVMSRAANKIGGEGTMIGIVECKFGNYRHESEQFKQEKFVIYGIQKGSHNFFLTVIDDHTCEVLVSILQEYVLPQTTVLSYSWKAFGGIQKLTSLCQTVNHNLKLIDQPTVTLSNFITRISSAVKRSLPDTCLEEDAFYLAEYLWRKKYKQSKERMNNLIDCIRTIYIPKSGDDPLGRVRSRKCSKRKVKDLEYSVISKERRM